MYWRYLVERLIIFLATILVSITVVFFVPRLVPGDPLGALSAKLANVGVNLGSKELVTIDTNVPVHLNLEAMRAGDPDYEACRVLFNELEFTTLLKNFVRTTDADTVEYGALKTEEQLERLLKQVGFAK